MLKSETLQISRIDFPSCSPPGSISRTQVSIDNRTRYLPFPSLWPLCTDALDHQDIRESHSFHPRGPGLPLSTLIVVEGSPWEGLAGETAWPSVLISDNISKVNKNDLGWPAFCIDQRELALLLCQLICAIRNGLNYPDTEIFCVTFALRTHR